MVLAKRIRAVNVAPKQTCQMSAIRHGVTEAIEYIACLHANAHTTPYLQDTLDSTALAIEFVNRELVIPGALPVSPEATLQGGFDSDTRAAKTRALLCAKQVYS